MSFYSEFATHYERVFPLREGTLAFLRMRLPSAGRVLDLGCGTGHYCGALAAAGLQAVGIDLDPLMIAAAQVAYPAAEFHVLDLRDVAALAPPFGGAYCIGNVLPHLAPAEVEDLLRSLRAVLSLGAPLIIQTVNFDRLLPLREPHQFPDLDAGGGIVFRRRYLPTDGDAVRFVTELREDDRVLFAGEETLWPWHAADLIAAGVAAGLEPVDHCGDFAGTPFVPHDSGANVLTFRTPY